MRFVRFILNDNLNELFPEFLKNWSDEQCMHLRDLIVANDPEAYQLAFGGTTIYCGLNDDVFAIQDVIEFQILPYDDRFNEDIIRLQLTDWAIHYIDYWHPEKMDM